MPALSAAISLLFGSALAATGSLRVDLADTPGEIILDGFPTGFFAPATLEDVPTGPHEVGLRYGCLWGERTVRVGKGDVVDVTLELKAVDGEGVVRLDGLNTRASAFLDGVAVDKASEGFPASCGGRRVSVEAPGHAVWARDIIVTTGQWTTVAVDLVQGELDEGAARDAGPAEGGLLGGEVLDVDQWDDEEAFEMASAPLSQAEVADRRQRRLDAAKRRALEAGNAEVPKAAPEAPVASTSSAAPAAEARTPEARAPEARTPEARAPEARTPEARTPEARAPEARTPEARTPEARALATPAREEPAAVDANTSPDRAEPARTERSRPSRARIIWLGASGALAAVGVAGVGYGAYHMGRHEGATETYNAMMTAEDADPEALAPYYTASVEPHQAKMRLGFAVGAGSLLAAAGTATYVALRVGGDGADIAVSVEF